MSILHRIVIWSTLLAYGYQSKRSSKMTKISNVKAISSEELKSIIIAYNDMYSYCQETFKLNPWNCPVPQRIKNTQYPMSFTALYPLATKEVAFIYSLAAASIVHQILNSCLMGIGKNFPCQRDTKQQYSDEMVDYNKIFDYAFRRGKRIIKVFDYKYIENNKRKMFNWKNSLIGIQLYKENLPTQCRCHGISGHCAVKSCRKTTPVSLQELSVKLKSMYKSAKRFEVTKPSQQDVGKTNIKYRIVRKTRNNNLLNGLQYIDESPNYCVKDLKLGIPGTLHRECDHYNKMSCSNLCDKCGYRKHSYLRNIVNKRCKCKFHWCCQVTCKTCSERKIFARCERPF